MESKRSGLKSTRRRKRGRKDGTVAGDVTEFVTDVTEFAADAIKEVVPDATPKVVERLRSQHLKDWVGREVSKGSERNMEDWGVGEATSTPAITPAQAHVTDVAAKAAGFEEASESIGGIVDAVIPSAESVGQALDVAGKVAGDAATAAGDVAVEALKVAGDVAGAAAEVTGEVVGSVADGLS